MNEEILNAYQSAVQNLYAVQNTWNPFKFLQDSNGGWVEWVSNFINALEPISIQILALCVILRLIQIGVKSVEDDIPAMVKLGSLLIESALVVGFIIGYPYIASILPKIFTAIAQNIYSSVDNSILSEIAKSVKIISNEAESGVSFFSKEFFAATVTGFFASAISGLAMAMFLVMSIYQGVMFGLWFFLGPILIPFYMFTPLRSVATQWFGSLVAYSFMGVVGAILFGMMAHTSFLIKSIGAGSAGDYIVSLVYSLLILLVMIQIPSIATGLWNGIQSSMMQAVIMASTVGGGATSTAIAGAGAGTAMAGNAARGGAGLAGVLNRLNNNGNMGLSPLGRLADGIKNRAESSPSLSTLEKGAAKVANVGTNVMMSQMPSSISKASKSFGTNISPSPAPLGLSATEQVQGIQNQAQKIMGKYGIEGLNIPDNPSLRKTPNQKDTKVMASAARKLLRDQGFIIPSSLNPLSQRELIRSQAEKLAGKEAAQNMTIPANPNLEIKKGQTEEMAAAGVARSLLAESGFKSSKQFKETGTPIKMSLAEQHKAMKQYAINLRGEKEGGRLHIPKDWRVMKRQGQSDLDAIQGTARALMQQQGIIDKKGESKIANRGKFTDTKKGRKPDQDNKDKE